MLRLPLSAVCISGAAGRIFPKLRGRHTVGSLGGRSGAPARRGGGVVDDAGALVREMARSGLDRKIKPGLYTLRRSTPRGAVKQLEKAKPVVERAALIPGSRFDRLAALFAEEGVTAADFYSAMAKAENFYEPVRKWLPEDVRARMVFLLPETYFVAPGPAVADGFIASASRLWFERVGKGHPRRHASERRAHARRARLRGRGRGPRRGGAPDTRRDIPQKDRKKDAPYSPARRSYTAGPSAAKRRRHSRTKILKSTRRTTHTGTTSLPPGPICVPSESSWKERARAAGDGISLLLRGRQGKAHIQQDLWRAHCEAAGDDAMKPEIKALKFTRPARGHILYKLDNRRGRGHRLPPDRRCEGGEDNRLHACRAGAIPAEPYGVAEGGGHSDN